MTDRPIIMARGPMLNLLAGRKTQTRRPVRKSWDDVTIAKPDPHRGGGMVEVNTLASIAGRVEWPCVEDQHGDWHLLRSPFGVPGDRLWVRETWARYYEPGRGETIFDYRADHNPEPRYPAGWDDADPNLLAEARELGHLPRWRPSIHMPREACRVHLRIKRVWVERVQAISVDDIQSEGVATASCAVCGDTVHDHQSADRDHGHGVLARYPGHARFQWRAAWDAHCGGPYAYDNNPLVWACEFEVATDD